jgi:hypothetical protein
MSDSFEILTEIEEILEVVSSLKNKTLDHYHEDKNLANQLMIDLVSLETEAKDLLNDFSVLV